MGQNPMQTELKKAAQQLSNEIELMKDKEKGDVKDILNIHLTINDYEFLSNQDGQYAVFSLQEEPGKFFFGGGVITDHLTTLDDKGFKETIQQEGLPVQFTSKQSKSGRYYTNAILYPEDQ